MPGDSVIRQRANRYLEDVQHTATDSNSSTRQFNNLPLDERSCEKNEILRVEDVYPDGLTLMEKLLLLGWNDEQGKLATWNDTLSFVLRGFMLIELAFLGRIQLQKEVNPREMGVKALHDREIKVIAVEHTGDALLDEAMRLMKQSQDGFHVQPGEWVNQLMTTLKSRTFYSSTTSTTGGGVTSHSGESDPNNPGYMLWKQPVTFPPAHLSIERWIRLLAGETWSLSRVVSFQMRNVRDRVAKGLVEKGILRASSRKFLWMDVPSQPLQDKACKRKLLDRLTMHLEAPKGSSLWMNMPMDICTLIVGAQVASVLEPAISDRTQILGEIEQKCGKLVDEFSDYSREGKIRMIGTSDEISQTPKEAMEIITGVLGVLWQFIL